MTRATGGAAQATRLEALATRRLEAGEIAAAAASLEAAGMIWSRLGESEREGTCLLLAATHLRLAGDLGAARRVLALAEVAPLSERLRRGCALEGCEQELAGGHPESALAGFGRILDTLTAPGDELDRSLVLQRRAVAALACRREAGAAEDFLQAARIFDGHAAHADAEAARLAAASILAASDPARAEQILARVRQNAPRDGAAATRRGLVGGKVAVSAGDPALALRCFDDARQGALGMDDPVSYYAAALGASRAAETMGDLETAYARLATAWATLADKLGKEGAAAMLRPELSGLRERAGTEAFAAAKQRYEAARAQTLRRPAPQCTREVPP